MASMVVRGIVIGKIVFRHMNGVGSQTVSHPDSIVEFANGGAKHFVVAFILLGRIEVPYAAVSVVLSGIVGLQVLYIIRGEGIIAEELVVA